MDPLTVVPSEILCEIISRVTDLEDIINFVNTSKIFGQYLYCVTHLTSNNNTTIQLVDLLRFPNLRIVAHNIMILITEHNLHLLPNVRYLKSAHFVVNDLKLLIPLINLVYKFGFFKITTEQLSTILIYDGKYIILGDQTKIISNIISLNVIDLEEIKTNIPKTRYLLLRKPMREFLKNTDFGLVNPNEPESLYNPPISKYANIISSMANFLLLYNFILIYGYFHGLVENNNMFVDDVLRSYFDIAIDSLTIADIGNIIHRNIMKNTLQDIIDIQPVYPISAEEDLAISNILSRTRKYYRDM